MARSLTSLSSSITHLEPEHKVLLTGAPQELQEVPGRASSESSDRKLSLKALRAQFPDVVSSHLTY